MSETAHTPKTALQILIAARALIEKPENWCKGEYQKGDACCALGAIHRVKNENPCVFSDSGPEYSALCIAMDGASINYFNDIHTHAEVIAAFDKAIEAERAKVSA